MQNTKDKQHDSKGVKSQATSKSMMGSSGMFKDGTPSPVKESSRKNGERKHLLKRKVKETNSRNNLIVDPNVNSPPRDSIKDSKAALNTDISQLV